MKGVSMNLITAVVIAAAFLAVYLLNRTTSRKDRRK
jgi:hypothetical protein